MPCNTHTSNPSRCVLLAGCGGTLQRIRISLLPGRQLAVSAWHPVRCVPMYSAAGQGLISVCSSPTATPLPRHHIMRRQVDLGDTFAVYKVVVYNRLTTQQSAGRLTHFEVRVGYAPAITSPIGNPLCATYTVPALSVYTFNCNPALVGRYIVVRLLTQCELGGASAPGRDGRLAICELQAFGVLTTPPAQNVPN